MKTRSRSIFRVAGSEVSRPRNRASRQKPPQLLSNGGRLLDKRSRGDKRRMSPAVIVRIVQASDLVLLLFSGCAGQEHADADALAALPMAHLFSRHA